MPVECKQLDDQNYKFFLCPGCNQDFEPFMRGQVQRSKRFLWIFGIRDYCAVICYHCKNIVGWESPPLKNSRDIALNAILMNILSVLDNLTEALPASEKILNQDIHHIRKQVLKLYE